MCYVFYKKDSVKMQELKGKKTKTTKSIFWDIFTLKFVMPCSLFELYHKYDLDKKGLTYQFAAVESKCETQRGCLQGRSYNEEVLMVC